LNLKIRQVLDLRLLLGYKLPQVEVCGISNDNKEQDLLILVLFGTPFSIMKQELPEKIAFIDTETTGCNYIHDRIIEIGILRVENGKLINTFESLINPERHVPPEIERITGINISELVKAPTFAEIKDEVLEMLDGCVFAAHNARFDYGFVKKELKELRVSFKAKQLCTAKLSRRLYPQFFHHNLDSLISRYGLDCPRRHRALDDARTIYHFYQQVCREIPKKYLTETVAKLLKRPTLPMHLQESEIQELPEGPGVYIFYGDNQTPLYVGKSLNIQQRVLSHFAADVSDTKEMRLSGQVKRIKTVLCGGELGALLKEAHLIRRLLPIYNRRSRWAQRMVALLIDQNVDGYKQLILSETGQISKDDLPYIAGIFKSKKQAKDYLVNIAKEFELCDKFLGLEVTNKACFGHQLGRCHGACCGGETPDGYNARLEKAIADTRIRPWPFDGAIIIKENNAENGLEENHLFDQWSYMGTLKVNDDLVDQESKEPIFDWEIYKILKLYLRKNRNISSIKLLRNNILPGLKPGVSCFSSPESHLSTD
jgi:DNA polymerase III subunit epsilon